MEKSKALDTSVPPQRDLSVERDLLNISLGTVLTRSVEDRGRVPRLATWRLKFVVRSALPTQPK